MLEQLAACVAMDADGAGSIEKAKMSFLLDKFNAPNNVNKPWGK